MWAGADGRYDVMMECPQDEPAGLGRGRIVAADRHRRGA